jgi:hypothetical protein
MLLTHFLDALSAGEERLYLTTEASQFDTHGRLRVVSSPLPALLDDVPLQPRVGGNLVPAALNMWFGRSADGSSSGLHHDWHDNIYSLLRGRKRFELYAPSETDKLYPQGTVQCIHPNGRINYVGSPSRADGADAADLSRVAQLDVYRAEQELAAAEAAVAARARGANARLQRAEAVLEDALAAALDADAELHTDGTESPALPDADDALPPHFSRCLGRKQALASSDTWPLFAEARMLTVDVQAGDALYIPAGWWHEVSSRGADTPDFTHLAVNWWYHPPDTADFDAPYSSDIWSRDWASWKHDILPYLNSS